MNLTLKDKILKVIIYITGFFALYIFIILRLNNTPGYLLDKEFSKKANLFEYGDLYLLNLVDNFNIATPPNSPSYIKSSKQPDINNADILTFGDSFFGGGARGKSFPERLSDTLKKKVFFMDSSEPLTILENMNYVKKERKILIFEIAERRIAEVFSKKHSVQSKNKQFILSIAETIYPFNIEQKYTFLLQRSFLTHYIYNKLSTFKFNEFGYITYITPVYKLDPPWIFYYQEVNDKKTSFYYKFSDNEINDICDNISDLTKQLNDKYNIEFIFLPIPNKYTIYHTVINNDEYNNLLPRIYTGLKNRNVKVCEVYNTFLESKLELYFPTDTHWNGDGVNLTLYELLKIINK